MPNNRQCVLKNIPCPLCNSPSTEIIFKRKGVSFANSSIRRDLVIASCRRCRFVFQPDAYTAAYARALEPVYRNFRKSEFFPFPHRTRENAWAVQCIARHTPAAKAQNILEIGSNRGDLLYLIKEKMPSANVIGVEPTACADPRVPTVNAFFSKRLFSSTFDTVIMQHSLEHITYPGRLLAEVREVMTKNGIVYVEVPYLINSLAYGVEDFSLEHVSYFSLRTLAYALRPLSIVSYRTTPFLSVIARRGRGMRIPDDTADLKEKFGLFEQTRFTMLSFIRTQAQQGKKIIFYGVSFYFRNLFKDIEPYIKGAPVRYYDDTFIKPREQGHGLMRLKAFSKDCVVVICSTNYLVQERIEKKLSAHKGITVLRPWHSIQRY